MTSNIFASDSIMQDVSYIYLYSDMIQMPAGTRYSYVANISKNLYYPATMYGQLSYINSTGDKVSNATLVTATAHWAQVENGTYWYTVNVSPGGSSDFLAVAYRPAFVMQL